MDNILTKKQRIEKQDTCWFCNQRLTRTGRKIQEHHVDGRKNTDKKVFVHKVCHNIIHKNTPKDIINTSFSCDTCRKTYSAEDGFPYDTGMVYVRKMNFQQAFDGEVLRIDKRDLYFCNQSCFLKFIASKDNFHPTIKINNFVTTEKECRRKAEETNTLIEVKQDDT